MALVAFGCPRKVHPYIGSKGCGIYTQRRILAYAHWHHAYAEVSELAGFRKHGICDFPERAEPFYNSVEHNSKMLVGIKVLYIPFSSIVTAKFQNFTLIEQIY